MKAEYFPPKEDVILQNEAPTDFYIFVTGAAVRNYTPLSFIHLMYALNSRQKMNCKISSSTGVT